MNRELIKTWSETLKNVAEIAAIIIAGYWSYHIFGQKEAPTLEPRGDASSSITWHRVSDNDEVCEADLQVNFENTGNSSYDISKIRLRGWKFEKIKQKDKFAAYLDLDEIQNSGQLFFEKVYQSDRTSSRRDRLLPFILHYPPGSAYNHDFEWVVNRDAKLWICFKVEFYKNGRKTDEDRPLWVTYSWDQMCNYSSMQE